MTDVDETIPLATLSITPQTPGITAGTGTVNTIPLATLSITPNAPGFQRYPLFEVLDNNGNRIDSINFGNLEAGRESDPQVITLVNNSGSSVDVTLTATLGDDGTTTETVTSTLLSGDDTDYIITTDTYTIPANTTLPVYIKWRPPSTSRPGLKTWTTIIRTDIQLSGWNSLNTFTITNTGDNDIYNGGVEITTPYVAGYMQTDFDDLRFYQGGFDSEAVELEYQLLNKTDGVSATFFVLIPSIPSGESLDIYIYGDNPSASSSSSLIQFVDTFTGPSIDTNKWSIDNNGVFSIDTGRLKINAGAFGKYIRAKTRGAVHTFTNGVIEFTLQSNGGYNEGGVAFRMTDMNNGYMFHPSTYSGSVWCLDKRVSGVTTSLFSVSGFTANITYTIRIVVNDSTITIYADDNELGSITDTSFIDGGVAVMSWGRCTSWFDDFTINTVNDDIIVGELDGWSDKFLLPSLSLVGGVVYTIPDLPELDLQNHYIINVGGVEYE